jgi:DNA-binding XRE family transcriptional regulator
MHCVGSASELSAAIGTKVRVERQAREWTLDQLAGAAGVSRRMIVNVEQGVANLSVTTLLRISDALGVGLPALVDVRQTSRVKAVRDGEGAVLWTGPGGGPGVLLAGTAPPDVLEPVRCSHSPSAERSEWRRSSSAAGLSARGSSAAGWPVSACWPPSAGSDECTRAGWSCCVMTSTFPLTPCLVDAWARCRSPPRRGARPVPTCFPAFRGRKRRCREASCRPERVRPASRAAAMLPRNIVSTTCMYR